MNARESWIVLRDCARVLRDSSRLEEIAEINDITGRPHFERELARLRSTPEGAALLDERRELCSKTVDYPALRALPSGTFGRDYVDHLDRHGLDADALCYPPPAPDDDDLTWLKRRYRSTHDIWHALLDLGAEPYQEVLIHAFIAGHLRLPISALIVTFGSVKHLVAERRWRDLRAGLRALYRTGRRCQPLLGTDWSRYWEVPTDEVRRTFGLRSYGELLHTR